MNTSCLFVFDDCSISAEVSRVPMIGEQIQFDDFLHRTEQRFVVVEVIWRLISTTIDGRAAPMNNAQVVLRKC
jgi:hypothetical protein